MTNMNFPTVETDLVVVGGGPAGFCASVAAARQGVRVTLVEKNGFAGGMATAGLVGPFMTCYDKSGETMIIRGLFEEVVERLVERGGAIHPAQVRSGSAYTSWITVGHDHCTPFDAEILKKLIDDMLTEAGVNVLYHVEFLETRMEDNFVAINKDAWDAAGLGELPDEWTWDEYIAASRAMTEYNADGSVSVYGGSNYSVIADLTNIIYQVNGCNRFYNADGTCAFDTDYLKANIQKFIDAENEGIWYPLESYRTDNYKEWFAYAEGKINSGVSGNVNRFLADTENYPQDHITAYAPYPVVEKGQTNYMSGVNYFSFTGMTMGCKDEEAAWAFVKFFSTYGSKYLTAAGHQSTWAGTDPAEIVSVIFGSEENAAKIIDIDSFKKWVGNASNPSSYDNINTAYSELNSIFSEYVMYAYTGDMTLDEAMAEATELGNQAIKDA